MWFTFSVVQIFVVLLNNYIFIHLQFCMCSTKFSVPRDGEVFMRNCQWKRSAEISQSGGSFWWKSPQKEIRVLSTCSSYWMISCLISHALKFQIKIIDKDKYRQVYENVMKNLDKLENEFLPQVSLNKTEVRKFWLIIWNTVLRQYGRTVLFIYLFGINASE